MNISRPPSLEHEQDNDCTVVFFGCNLLSSFSLSTIHSFDAMIQSVIKELEKKGTKPTLTIYNPGSPRRDQFFDPSRHLFGSRPGFFTVMDRNRFEMTEKN